MVDLTGHYLVNALKVEHSIQDAFNFKSYTVASAFQGWSYSYPNRLVHNSDEPLLPTNLGLEVSKKLTV